MEKLPIPPQEAIIYDDEKVYICLASHAITNGHTVVVWKTEAKDITMLTCKDYEYLMHIVEVIRNTLLTTLGIEKVYLIYMDEIKQVHWHLVPRYDEQGFNVFNHTPVEVNDFSIAEKLKQSFALEIKKHKDFN